MAQDFFLFGIGIVAGAMNAIAGGGTLAVFPALMSAGLPALVANATSNLVVLPGQIASAYAYRHYLAKLPRRYLWLLLPCVAGALAGAVILRYTPASRFERIVPELIGFAVVMFAFQPMLHNRLNRHLQTTHSRPKNLTWIAIALLPMAIYGGYFGAGFGFVMLAFLGLTPMHRIHQMNALKNLSSAGIALASLAVLARGSFVDWHGGLIMAAGSAAGGYLGARLAQRVPSHAVRAAVIVIGIATAVFVAMHY